MATFMLYVEIFFEIVGTLLEVLQELVVAVPVYDGVLISSKGLADLVQALGPDLQGDLHQIVARIGDKGPDQAAVVALHDLGHLTEGIVPGPGGNHQYGPGFPKKGGIDEDPDNVLQAVVAQDLSILVQNGKQVGFVPGKEFQYVQPGRVPGDRKALQFIAQLLD